jgi:CRAL/TRIO, N-terminal domain
MADLTAAQMTALEKMRRSFPETDSNGFLLNDATFLRYLRARSFDATKSSAMLAATVKWRKDFGIADMHSKSWEEILAKENSTGKMYVRGLSREGHPILYMKPKLENTNEHDGNMVTDSYKCCKHALLLYSIKDRILVISYTTGKHSDILLHII